MRKHSFAEGGQSIIEFAILAGFLFVAGCALLLIEAVKQNGLVFVLRRLGIFAAIVVAVVIIKKRA